MDTYEQADQLLDLLDKAQIGASEALFADELAKQWMGSCIIRSVKKLQAAEYHCSNVHSEVHELYEAAQRSAASFPSTHGAMFLRHEKDEIAFELDAFLAAARACIDLVSGMLALHIKGMDRKTGSTALLRMSERDPASPFSDLLKKRKKWIEEVKEYRDQCIHFQTMYLSGGYKIESQDGKNVVTIFPVLVPKKILPDKPTTRTGRNAMMIVDLHKNIGIAGIPPDATQPLSDEAKKILELLAEFEPGDQHVPVEDFCEWHLEKLHQFVSESFREVLPGKFKTHFG